MTGELSEFKFIRNFLYRIYINRKKYGIGVFKHKDLLNLAQLNLINCQKLINNRLLNLADSKQRWIELCKTRTVTCEFQLGYFVLLDALKNYMDCFLF